MVDKTNRFISFFEVNTLFVHPSHQLLIEFKDKQEQLLSIINEWVQDFCIKNNIGYCANVSTKDIRNIIETYLERLILKYEPIKDVIDMFGQYKIVSVGNNHYGNLNWIPNLSSEVEYNNDIQKKYFNLKLNSGIFFNTEFYIDELSKIFKGLIILSEINKNKKDFQLNHDLLTKTLKTINDVCEASPIRKKLPQKNITIKNPYGLDCNDQGYPYLIDGCKSSIGYCINSHSCGVCDYCPI